MENPEKKNGLVRKAKFTVKSEVSNSPLSHASPPTADRHFTTRKSKLIICKHPDGLICRPQHQSYDFDHPAYVAPLLRSITDNPRVMDVMKVHFVFAMCDPQDKHNPKTHARRDMMGRIPDANSIHCNDRPLFQQIIVIIFDADKENTAALCAKWARNFVKYFNNEEKSSQV